MQACWILGLAAGCAFHHGEVPVDATPDVSSVSDEDGDGVSDQNDNCPQTANADQRDHDGDSHGDACDHCPHLSSTGDPDADGDGVGDSCDPRPQSAGDQRVIWEPFDSISAATDWSNNGTGGSWSVANGTLRQTQLGADTVLTAPGTFSRIYVNTRLTVDALGSAAWIGFRTGVIGFTQYYACLMQVGPAVLATSYAMGTQNENHASPWPGTFSAGTTIELVQNLAAANTCGATQGTTTANTTASITGSAAGAFQFYTRDAAATFDYVFAVEVGN